MQAVKRAKTYVIVASSEEVDALTTVLHDFEEMCTAHDKDEGQRRIWKRELKAIKELRKALAKAEE